MKSCVFFIFLLFCLGCTSAQKLDGIYVNTCSNFINDTLFINDNGLFEQHFYDARVDTLLNTNKNTWNYEGVNIQFINFFINQNIDPREYSFTDKGIESAVIDAVLPLSWGRMIIDLDLGCYYEKLD